METDKKIRLDKWLKISRIYKTREQANRACDEGKVKVNAQKCKPAHVIAIGDKITIKNRNQYRTIDVVEILQKNVSNKDAKLLYKEHTPELSEASKQLYEILQESDKQGKRKYKGRPTKKERRKIDRLKSGNLQSNPKR